MSTNVVTLVENKVIVIVVENNSNSDSIPGKNLLYYWQNSEMESALMRERLFYSTYSQN